MLKTANFCHSKFLCQYFEFLHSKFMFNQYFEWSKLDLSKLNIEYNIQNLSTNNFTTWLNHYELERKIFKSKFLVLQKIDLTNIHLEMVWNQCMMLHCQWTATSWTYT